MKEDNKMKQIIRLFILIAALVLGADYAWANAESNPRVKFVYVDEQHGSAFAGEADANRQVTITVTPEGDWRCINGDLTAEVTSNSNMAEAPRRSPGVGQSVAVNFERTNVFTLTLPEEETLNVTVTVSFSEKDTFTPTVSIEGWTYGEDAKVPTLGNSNESRGDVTYTYADTENGTYSTTVPTLAGSHWVKATVAATADYCEAVSSPVEFTIAPKPITIYEGSVNVDDKEYDGTTNGTLYGTMSFVEGMIVEGDQVNIDASGASAVFENPNVGEDKVVTVTGFVLVGADKDNYQLENTTITTTGSITKKDLTVTANDWTIDYGEEPANDDVEYDGFVNGEDERALSGTLGFDYTYSKYGPVGTYQIMPNGLTSDNYNIIFQPGTLTVKQVATISVDWDDNYNFGSLRPGSLEFKLLANVPNAEPECTVTLNEGNWTATVKGLTAYNGTELIQYTWSLVSTPETLSNNYDSDENQSTTETGATATFTYTRKTGSLTVRNTVVSDLAADATVPFTYTVKLTNTNISDTYSDMTFTDGEATVTLKAGESATATNLLYGTTYTVTQTETPGFDTEKTEDTGTISTSSTQATFTNTRETGNLTVTNTVYPSDNGTDFVFTVTLSDTTIDGNYGEMTFNNGVATFALTGQTSNNSNSRTATGLPTTVEYTVTQTANDDFSTTKTGDTGTISATLSEAAFKNIMLTEARFDIDWHDGGNESSRPDGLTTALLSKLANYEGEPLPVEGQGTITLNEENNWHASVPNLPMYNEDGTEIAYSWREIESVPSGYLLTDHSTGIDASFTYTLKTSATVKIEWDDANNQDGIRPTEMTATLSNGKYVTLNPANSWTAMVEDLPKYNGNDVIDYNWTPGELPEGYSLDDDMPKVDDVTTIKYSHTPEETAIKVSKVWNDNNNAEGFRTESVTVRLKKGDTEIESVVLHANNSWEYTWSNLQKYENGTAINYTVTEDPVANYSTQITKADGSFTYTVTNTAINVSGNCGQTSDDGSDVTWHYGVTTKALTISGTGQMMDYSSDQGSDNQYHSTAPWSHFDSEIETVVVVEGVTYIGNDAFAYCPALTSVSLPSTLEAIGNNAFTGCTSLTPVTLNGGVTIGNNAFPANATVTIADGLRLYNGMKVLSGAVTDMDDVNGKDLRPAVKITLPTGVTATGTDVFDQNDETYALPGATVTLGYTGPEGSIAVYTVTKDGTDPAETVVVTKNEGVYTFTMPANDVTVTVLTNIVTPNNFFSFFDDSGTLQDNVPFDELIFKGNFSNSNNELVPYIILDRAITITGVGAVLNDMGFIIAGNDVTLDNLTLVADCDLGNLIDIAGENVVISNSNIKYVVTDYANAINVYSGANGVQILKNTIYFESTVDDYAADDVTAAICVNSGISLFDDEDPIEGLVIDGNEITAVIPAFLVDIYENEYYVMGLSAVNGVRINGAEDFKFTNNTLDVTTNRLDRTSPTFQAMYVASSSGLIDGNKISMIDEFTPKGKDVYLYALELINDEDLDILNNNFNLSTTGGKDEAGSANAIIAIGSDFSVVDNNITTVSKGPNVGIYFPSKMAPPCDAVISGNLIKVTGLATAAHETGLVSGIEIETGCVEISGNTICTYNIGEYAEGNYIYGISYAQDGVTPDVEITDNTIYTEGKYAISLKSADDAYITENALCAHELFGDDAVFIESGDNNTVENNILGYVMYHMPKTGENTYNIPANVSSFKVYDDGGISGRYSAGCDGTLKLTAPDGYLLQLSGSITTEKDNDYLTVYDGSNDQADKLIDQVSSSVSGTEAAIPTVISSGRNMTLYFYSDNSSSDKTEFDGLNLTVRLIYNLNETDGITDAIATEIAGKPAQFQRTGITANAYSTVCLPFDFTAPTGCTIYGFQGIHYDENALGAGQGAWVADIAAASTMTAHTPYIFTCTGTEVTFSGTASDADNYSSALTSNAVIATVGDDKAWTFKGTYSAIDWSSADPTEPTYGFSTYVPAATIAAGTFVRFVKGASLAPFRARLIYSGSDTHLNAPKRGAANDLPQYIIVRIVESDGSTTAIGTLDTRTGEISTGDWFDLNGRRLPGKPTKKGLYINNGNTVVIK